ncbi:uroporphyrinogen-III synthase [Escherichia albertii]|uniref:uroporphyrinogen-III synthase n=1 Tax=Escherichia albertii TaxID=208962 RepID=UPI00071F3AFB|nr:uroporphyrinogen-III synthase [Escherichia albertii]EFO1265450.1 uroporphyrinogen-III synthase [Escherichia albertii]EGM8834615.1 uroporphyrinogen-III synthase [Escherichia albertii]EJZ9665632.1 uroporphyrinogen-III synthase [Escherichia albertii]EKB4281047.1 uroporphyrinogen-III synthase [Escherichia albertii]MCQ8918265.1 uroporphyrinogen-III synthase [Escherichia albertii]
MSILVTRPSPAGEELVSRLRALGQVAWHFPLIEFSPGRQLPQLADQLTALGEGDLLFVLSQHAVAFAQSQLHQQSLEWPTFPAYFAIGRTTALALHTVSGHNVRYPQDREISEVLLQLPELQNIVGKRALVLRGNGGRELIGETLTARGAEVVFCECYQRCAIHYDGAEEAIRWQSRGVTTIVVTSGEMLQQLWTLIPQWYREHWLLCCRLLVVSERLAKLARELGWKDIKVADNADNDALLRALQ